METAAALEPGLMEMLDPEVVLAFMPSHDPEPVARLIDLYRLGPPAKI